MKLAYLSLGSNLGDREGMLRKALESLEDPPRLHVRRVSRIYETEPMVVRDQPRFLNLVAEIETAFLPMQLLARTSRIERELGRKRVVAKGPRSIDIDIILYGNAVVESQKLTIPHVAFRERQFVLAPLAELAPDYRDPVTRKCVRELLAAVGSQGVRVYAG